MKRIILLAVGAVVVTGAFALPASAGEHPNDRAGLQGVGGVAATTPTDISPVTQPGRPDGRELPDGADLAPASPTIVVAGDAFDWGDAAIGLVGGLGVALVLGGIMASAQHSRRLRSASL